MASKNIIVHGDSRDHIAKVTTPINCILTDPPYGIDVKMNSASSPEQRAINERIQNDGDVNTAINLFHSVMGPMIPKLATQAEIYVFTAWNILDVWMEAVRDLKYIDTNGEFVLDMYGNPIENGSGIELKMCLIWDKGYPGKGDLVANWGCGYEPCLYLKKGRRPLPYRRSGIIHVDKVASGQNIHPCLPPGEMVLTDQGYRRIEEIEIGEQVWSHDGRYHEVTNKFSSKCTDPYLIRVKVAGQSESTTTTDNHPYLVYRPVRHQKSIVGHEVQWLPALEIRKGDYLMTPISAYDEESLEVNPDVAYIMGLWLAEGSKLHNGRRTAYYPQFALHEDEDWIVDRIRNAFPDTSIGVYEKPESKGIQVVIFNSTLIPQFEELMRSGARNKFVSSQVLDWSWAARKNFIEGYFDGDGWRRDREVRVKTASDDLAATLPLVAESVGYNSSVVKHQPDKPTMIEGRLVQGGTYWTMEFWPKPDNQRRPLIVEHEGVHYRVRYVQSILLTPRTTEVWNLTVEGTHTFQTYVGMTHNTEKPVQLLETLIEMSTDPGDLVVDPFSGSGSTSVAAQRLGRNSLAFEIDNEPPRSFVDKSRERLKQLGLFG